MTPKCAKSSNEETVVRLDSAQRNDAHAGLRQLRVQYAANTNDTNNRDYDCAGHRHAGGWNIANIISHGRSERPGPNGHVVKQRRKSDCGYRQPDHGCRAGNRHYQGNT